MKKRIGTKLRVVFAKPGEGLREEVGDYLKIHKAYPKWLALSAVEKDLLLEIREEDYTFQRMPSSAMTRLIYELRDCARALLKKKKLGY